MKRTQQQFIVDILEAMAHAEEFIKDLSIEELQNDVRTQWALERAFAIIGEAAKKVAQDLKDRYPELPWRDIAGMRDFLVHGYWMIQLEIIVDTIRIDFPKHKPVFKQILEDLKAEE